MTKVKFIKSGVQAGLAYGENEVANIHPVLAQSLTESGFVEILEDEVKQAVEPKTEVKKAVKKRG